MAAPTCLLSFKSDLYRSKNRLFNERSAAEKAKIQFFGYATRIKLIAFAANQLWDKAFSGRRNKLDAVLARLAGIEGRQYNN